MLIHVMNGILLEAASGPAPWAAIVLGVLTLVYLVVIRPMRKGRKKDPLVKAPTQVSLSHQRAIEREMGNLLVEYEEMIRRMTAQVDTRAAKLELLIQEADQKLAQLRAAGVKPKNTSEIQDIGAAGLPLPAKELPVQASEVALPRADEDRHREVYRLADRGRSAQQIARQIDRPMGEIELILALRQSDPPEQRSKPTSAPTEIQRE